MHQKKLQKLKKNPSEIVLLPPAAAVPPALADVLDAAPAAVVATAAVAPAAVTTASAAAVAAVGVGSRYERSVQSQKKKPFAIVACAAAAAAPL